MWNNTNYKLRQKIHYSNSTRGELEIIRSFPSCIYNITHINESPQGVKPIISCTMAEEEVEKEWKIKSNHNRTIKSQIDLWIWKNCDTAVKTFFFLLAGKSGSHTAHSSQTATLSPQDNEWKNKSYLYLLFSSPTYTKHLTTHVCSVAQLLCTRCMETGSSVG